MDINLDIIPTAPGVYLFKSQQNEIIYVGKAKHLRRRVSSYFRKSGLPVKTQAMLRQAASLDTLSTTTEKEALLLEAELIKKHRPRYNITLRDDKQYFLFRLDKNHPFPRLAVVRPRSGAAARRRGIALFGPYASSLAARETWRLLHQIFPLRRCTEHMFRNRVRPCLYHQMKQCLGPCALPVDREDYARMVEQVELFLNGRSRELLDILKARMAVAARDMDYERAAAVRDQIRDVEKTVEQQAVVSQAANDFDVLGLAASGGGLGLAVIFVRSGKVMDGRVFFWPGLSLAESNEAIHSFLGQFYNQPSLIPSRILLPWKLTAPDELSESGADCAKAPENSAEDAGGAEGAAPAGEAAGGGADAGPDSGVMDRADQAGLWEDVLSELRGSPTRLFIPHNARERGLVRMAEANARQGAKNTDQIPLAGLLAAGLRLAAPPERIEAVDISHTGGQTARAGLAVFVDGVPRRDEFRAYILEDAPGAPDESRTMESGESPADEKTFCGQKPLQLKKTGFTPGDDYGALAAWVRRRLDSGPPWPDLLLIDGGPGQLAAVENALLAAGQGGLFALAAIAKARAENGRPDRRAGNVADRIFIPGRKNPLPLQAGSPELLFLQRVRDAVHDYALGRHRSARNKAALTSVLLDAPGIGPKTAALLWAHFDSLPDMAAATEEDLAAIPGLGEAKARRLKAGLARFAED